MGLTYDLKYWFNVLILLSNIAFLHFNIYVHALFTQCTLKCFILIISFTSTCMSLFFFGCWTNFISVYQIDYFLMLFYKVFLYFLTTITSILTGCTLRTFHHLKFQFDRHTFILLKYFLVLFLNLYWSFEWLTYSLVCDVQALPLNQPHILLLYLWFSAW